MGLLRGAARWLGWSRIAGMGLLVALLALRILDPAVVQGVRNAAFDFYQQLKPREAGRFPVAILDIDDSSLTEVGQWPWPRTKIAELVQKATAAGAVAIAFDIVFSEPDRLSPANIAADNPGLPADVLAGLRALPGNDDVLAQVMANARVILGQTSVRSAAGNKEEKQDMVDVEHAFLGPDPTRFLLHFPDIVQNLPALEANASGRGVFSVLPDPDGIIRRIPLVMMVQDKIRLGLAPELLRVATGGGAFAVRSNEAGIDGVVVARQLIATDRDGTVWPYFAPSSQARYVSAGDVLAGRVPQGRLAGHLLLVGTSAIGLEDFRATPLGVSMAGVEIHAQLLENILAKTLLVRPNYSIAVELLTILVLSLLVIVLVPRLGATWTLLLTAVLLASYAAVSYGLFDRMRILLDPTFPIIAAGLSVVLMSTANYIREERQKRQIRGAFGQYVSPDLVAQLAENPDRLILGGETRDLSILFSDVRGFTTISESFKDNPAGLTVLMNRFLTVLSNAILKYNGTIDKFMGDAVMAFWNAPLDNPDHIRSSCRAALKMMQDVEDLNRRREEEAAANPTSETLHRINVGVGINTGSCVVGNMGSDTRFDYTALGDAVNLASRLEGQSKPYGVGIILGSKTAEPVLDEMAIIELDLIRVKGKNEPERIYGLFGDEEMAASDSFAAMRRANARMLAQYRAQDWTGARATLGELAGAAKSAGLELDEYVALYVGRLDEFEANPVPADWDGVYTATSK